MEIKVLSIGQPVTKTKGKNVWQEIEVVYEGKKGEQKRTIRSFEEGIYPIVATFADDVPLPALVDVEVKKEGDYWQWKSMKAITEKSRAATDGYLTPGVPINAKKAGNWETAEERAAREQRIVRQSSIKAAVEYLAGRGDASVEDVLSLARRFEGFVFGDDTQMVASSGVKAASSRKASKKEVAETPADAIE